MIPYDFFYQTIYNNFLKDLDVNCFFVKLTDTQSIDYVVQPSLIGPAKSSIIFYDQEPIDQHIFKDKFRNQPHFKNSTNRILITSERGAGTDSLKETFNMGGFDYFYHALLCIEWYRYHQHIPNDTNSDFDKVYITYNNLMADKRLYRTNLLVDLQKRNLLDKGYTSFNTPTIETIARSIETYKYLLPASHKANILENLALLDQKHHLDSNLINGTFSAKLDIKHLQSGFVNLVTETIFYENKVHLTEKSFKPIVSKMPFILLAGSGNLAYLKEYGFKTFSDYWDESYDLIESPTQRFDAVMDVLTKLSNTSISELRSMQQDMRNILEHNYHHFYYNLKPIVVDELTTQLGKSLSDYNIAFNQSKLQALNKILRY